MLRKVLEWPNQTLKKVSSPIFKIDEETKNLAKDLVDTCNIMFGAGLAAPQIGVTKRMIVIKPAQFGAANVDPYDHNSEYMVMINPTIETGGEMIEWVEACLSLPGTDGKVKRYADSVVTYMSLDGETKTIQAGWPFAGGLQHEIDHLDGKVFINRQDKKKSRSTLYKLSRHRRKEMIAARKARRMRNDH